MSAASDYLSAVGREVGKVDTDSGGLARYSLKLQAAPGIKTGNEPELSLEYCQGCPNASLGLGWALGGLSTIRLAPSNLAYDGKNTPPANYDKSKPKLTLDGAQLLNVSGEYGAVDAAYTTEIDSLERTITTLGEGFILCDSIGRQTEYGTTADSQTRTADKAIIREWRLKRQSDCHGNTVTYTYVTSPQPKGSSPDDNTCYLSSIRYTSNPRTGHLGSRIVTLDYSPRPDVVVQISQGEKIIWGHLLTAVRFGVIRDETTRIDRSYELTYLRSASTGDSLISSITETAPDHKDGKVELLPSTFGYTSTGVSKEESLFKIRPQSTVKLAGTVNNVAVFTMNISGRCLADIACVRFNPVTKVMSIKTYLADVNSDGSLGWKASQGLGSEAELPQFDLSAGFPSILCPDLNGDGRSDMIIPYEDSDGMIRFSISQSTGTGFQKSRSKATSFRWTKDSKFMAIDLTGRGTIDIVQIFTDRQKLAFRSFAAVTREGKIGLGDAVPTPTDFDNVNTVDWVQLSNPITGAKSLVRIWGKDLDGGQRQMLATTFTIANPEQPGLGLKVVKTSPLGAPSRKTQVNCHVLACDINGDGTQDIVLATAQYRVDKMVLTYDIFLGDGFGGFEKHGEIPPKQLLAPEPRKGSEYGEFHITNLNGSNYPSLSYLYQEKRNKAFACLTIDGRSDASISEPVLHRITGDMPSDSLQTVAVDLNGNGMGDWLFFTLDNDSPRLCPVYNTASVTDFLSWAQDPMGLRTSITYGTLSDPAVHKPSVEWKNYTNTSEDSYPVIAAPNCVVTSLNHTNSAEHNALDYQVHIQKTYESARVSTRGRGWQGFGQIHTLNVTDNVLTTEKYLQAWPTTGLKCQIDTKTREGKVVKSERTSYEGTFTSRGPWKIYQTLKTSEQTDMMDDENPARSTVTSYAYDEHGNVILQASSEIQHGRLTHQSWQRFTYTTINGITGLLTSKKLSSKEANAEMSTFENGDTSLVTYTYDPFRATLVSTSDWSTEMGSFAATTYEYDQYGNEVRSVDSAGLETSTVYDDVFNTHPVRVSEKGLGVSSVTLSGFDEASGEEIAKLEANGSLSCYLTDQFGRITETRRKSSGQSGPSVISANEFFRSKRLVTGSDFAGFLQSCSLEPHKKLSFEIAKPSSGASFLCSRATTHYKDGIGGQSEVAEYTDCVGRVRRRSSRKSADDEEQTWMYWDCNSKGEHTFESFPFKAPSAPNTILPDVSPSSVSGIRSSFDVLGRVTTCTTPAHASESHFVTQRSTYLHGGATVKLETFKVTGTDSSTASETLLSVTQSSFINVGGEECLTEQIGETGRRVLFEYNLSGELIQCTDPSGNKETRTYNSRGALTTFNNPYQNRRNVEGTPAIRQQYDISGYLIREIDVLGQSTVFQRDAKGRPLRKIGYDGRTLVYEYDKDGFEHISSITIYPQGLDAPMESRIEVSYDHIGRVKDRKLTLPDGSTYLTTLSYDWQDNVVQKTLPDGAIVMHDYRGSAIQSSVMEGAIASTWSLKADFTQYNAFGKPEALTVKGTGMPRDFSHQWQYDSRGFPLSHSLSSDSQTLVQEHYTYNDHDQMSRKHEFHSGSTVDYSYLGKRLISSQSGDAKNSYAYDDAGNLTLNRGVSISHQPGSTVGVKNGVSVFDITYDGAGRMIDRVTDSSRLSATYDSFGDLKSITDAVKGNSLQLLTDHEGETLQRKHADGSIEILISPEFVVQIQPDGSKVIRHKLFGAEHILGTVSNTYESAASSRPLGEGRRKVDIQFSDTKGTVTHIFNGTDASLLQSLDYDDYGLLQTPMQPSDDAFEKDSMSTYEGRYLDEMSGLLDFGARWYDPLVGRFTKPDDITDEDLLKNPDGMNRYAFENNDPINHIDPSGHWSLSSVVGTYLGVSLVVASIAVTIATGGAAAPLAAAAVGALAGGGVAGIAYSVQHRNEDNAAKFWGGFATTVAINATIGAATGALGAWASSAKVISGTGRLASALNWAAADSTAVKAIGTALSIGAKAVIGGTASVLSTAGSRGVEKMSYGGNTDLFAGAGTSFKNGAILGAIAGAWGARGSFKSASSVGASLAQDASDTASKVVAEPGVTWRILKNSKKPGLKLASWAFKTSGAKEWASSQLGRKGSHVPKTNPW